MGLAHSPRIVTNGLVFAYDMENTKKSWKGKPTTNLVPYDFTSWTRNSNGLTITETGTFEGTPTYSLIETATTDYHRCGYAIASSAGSTRRCSFIAKSYGSRYARSWSWTGGTTGASFFDLINGTTSGSNSPTIQNLYDGWYYCTFQVDSANNDTVVIATSPNSTIGTGTFTGTAGVGILITKPQLEVGTFATPFVNGTRSNSQSLLEMTNKLTTSIIPIGAFGYNSDNTVSFVGTNYYYAGDLSAAAQGSNGIGLEYTVNLWFRPSVVENYRNVFDGASLTNYGPRLEMNSNGKVDWYIGNSSGGYQSFAVRSSGLEVNQYHNVTLTVSGALTKTYYNGTLVTSATATTPNDSDRMIGVRFGNGFSTSSERYFKGDIPIVQIYNRVLSDAEIKRNFDAVKWRYGL